jgi:phosphonopyruvate decarboxylase
MNISGLAAASGYSLVLTADNEENLDSILSEAINAKDGPVFIEIKCACGSRSDLGRPTSTPAMNRDALMSLLRS